jgi:hypothetical protein
MRNKEMKWVWIMVGIFLLLLAVLCVVNYLFIIPSLINKGF